MHLHRSNRLEVLARALAGVLSVPPRSPFESEVVVVQSSGMERWLSMSLSDQLGVFAGAQFPFPRSFVERVIAHVLGEEADAHEQPFSRAELTWTIAAQLPRLLPREEFAELASYVSGDVHGEKRIALSSRIADVFDQYPVYRPELVTTWEAGGGEGFQPVLWRAVVAERGARHVAARAARFFDRVSRLTELPPGLPRRVSVFGVATFPPFYLTVLDAFSTLSEVHLFLLSPSREYWAEIRSRRDIARQLRATDLSAQMLGLSEENPLLSSLGTTGKELQIVLEGSVDYQEDDRDLYLDEPPRTMLQVIQSDVLSLTRRGTTDAPKMLVSPSDRSIDVQVCHSPTRELEALRDRLLALFEEDDTLEPRDVIVMVPEIETYGSLVPAVFQGTPSLPGFLPYRVVDRRVTVESEVLTAFFALLTFVPSRATVSGVLDLLSRRPIREAFALTIDDVAELTALIARAGVRWGFRASHRHAEGYPSTSEGTWKFGLDRLLLGYAMPLNERSLFAGALPFDDVEGSRAQTVGKLADVIERLESFVTLAKRPHTLSAWRTILEDALSSFLSEKDAEGEDADALRTAMAELERRAKSSHFTEEITLSTVQRELTSVLEAQGSSHAFLSLGITFCALLPMRSIPFRVVCLVGMNDGVFPRSDRRASFDLMAQAPRPGDRSARDEDRYLFLEAILSARDRLIVTYVGKNIHDGSALPPSVVVSELLDVVQESFDLPANSRAETIIDHVRTEHPLSAFSSAYFDSSDPKLESFSAFHREGAEAARANRTLAPSLTSLPLRATEPLTELSLSDLESMLLHPSRFFLERRLGIRLPRETAEVLDREPLSLSKLDRHAVRDALFAFCLEGGTAEDAALIARARGQLPLGTMGDLELREVLLESRELSARTLTMRGGERRPPRRVNLLLGEVRLTGALSELYPRAQVLARAGRTRARSLLTAWVRHLVLQMARAEDDPVSTALVTHRGREKDGADVITEFLPVRDPHRHLSELLTLYAMTAEVPLALFPETSFAYAAAKPESAESEGWKEWRHDSPQQGKGEEDDEHVARLVGGRAPFERDFRVVSSSTHPTFDDLAHLVFDPLLAHRKRSEP